MTDLAGADAGGDLLLIILLPLPPLLVRAPALAVRGVLSADAGGEAAESCERFTRFAGGASEEVPAAAAAAAAACLAERDSRRARAVWGSCMPSAGSDRDLRRVLYGMVMVVAAVRRKEEEGGWRGPQSAVFCFSAHGLLCF